MDFAKIKVPIAKQFEKMQKHPMFRVKTGDNDFLWETYLRSFPPGSNPIFKERTEHDCTCCKQFIRTVGDVVAIINGKRVSVWDVIVDDRDYQAVAVALSATVHGLPIEEPFLHYERHAGTDKNFQQHVDGTRTWTHFHVQIDKEHVQAKDRIPTIIGEKRTSYELLERGLREITIEAMDTVIELAAQNSIYRAQEHIHLVQKLKALKISYEALPMAEREAFLWLAAKDIGVARARNTVIGTLLVDLSEGKLIEHAVAAYELKVAPANYKRPVALVTKAMIENAKKDVEELGYTSALARRFAVLDDISINNVLFADRSIRKNIGGDVFDQLAAANGDKFNVKNLGRVEEIPIDKFIDVILPTITSMDVLLENRHEGNLVSLITADDPTAALMFKWKNRFSWSYAGEMADSVKERVKKAGGNVTGDLCCRLGWFNKDDLDFHMMEPDGGRIFYASKHSSNGGQLDVDMNAWSPLVRDPVENIFYGDHTKMREGEYTLMVNKFNRRENEDYGFEVEIDYLGDVKHFTYDRRMERNDYITVAQMYYSKKDGLKFIATMPEGSVTKTQWGLPTQSFHRVNVLMRSPNHWDGEEVGNKHYFFMLDKCANDGTARGFFNEFLDGRLDRHRKVFEMVGSKMKLAGPEQQLSGLGFSSTQKNHVMCRVIGSFSRIIKITF